MSEDRKEKREIKVKETGREYFVDERYEIIGGVRYDLHLLASPKVNHQVLQGNLYTAFRSSCAQDGIILQTVDIHFDDENILQPDVLYIANENRHIIRDGYVYGAPEIVVEILSDGTARRDKTLKKTTYERFGVKEYWIADPVYRLIEQFVLADGRYMLAGTLGREDRLVSHTVPCPSIELSAIFTDDDFS